VKYLLDKEEFERLVPEGEVAARDALFVSVFDFMLDKCDFPCTHSRFDSCGECRIMRIDSEGMLCPLTRRKS